MKLRYAAYTAYIEKLTELFELLLDSNVEINIFESHKNSPTTTASHIPWLASQQCLRAKPLWIVEVQLGKLDAVAADDTLKIEPSSRRSTSR